MIGESTVIRATTLREQVFQAIRKDILAGRLKPGEKLLEAEVAARLGLSRNPVREAIARLEQTGLVTSIANRGTYVVRLSKKEAHDLLLLRVHLELLAVRLALHDPQPGQFNLLAPLVARMKDVLDQPLDVTTAHGHMSYLDSEFHQHLVRCSQSKALGRAWDALAGCDLIFMQVELFPTEEEARRVLRRIVQNHVDLLEALRSGDPQVAYAGVRNHFRDYMDGGTGYLSAEDFNLLD